MSQDSRKLDGIHQGRYLHHQQVNGDMVELNSRELGQSDDGAFGYCKFDNMQ